MSTRCFPKYTLFENGLKKKLLHGSWEEKYKRVKFGKMKARIRKIYKDREIDLKPLVS